MLVVRPRSFTSTSWGRAPTPRGAPSGSLSLTLTLTLPVSLSPPPPLSLSPSLSLHSLSTCARTCECECVRQCVVQARDSEWGGVLSMACGRAGAVDASGHCDSACGALRGSLRWCLVAGDPIRVVMTPFFSPFLGIAVSHEGLVFVCLLGCELG